jgi:hypothetical protein
LCRPKCGWTSEFPADFIHRYKEKWGVGIVPVFKAGDEVIWDSGHGYEIGIFIKDNDFNQYNTYLYTACSGRFAGKESTSSKSDLYPYSLALAKELSIKYGCPLKSF